ncbi:hypothetical protein V6N13_037595 [Hibiscus sabdariffa]
MDIEKRAAGSGLPGRQGKKFRDGRFRLESRCGDFGYGSRVQSYAGTSAGVSLCGQCNRCHSRECWWATGACMACGSKDH